MASAEAAGAHPADGLSFKLRTDINFGPLEDYTACYPLPGRYPVELSMHIASSPIDKQLASLHRCTLGKARHTSGPSAHAIACDPNSVESPVLCLQVWKLHQTSRSLGLLTTPVASYHMNGYISARSMAHSHKHLCPRYERKLTCRMESLFPPQSATVGRKDWMNREVPAGFCILPSPLHT